MTYIAPRTEKLARAMCEAVNIPPDIDVDDLEGLNRTKYWHAYVWQAQLWIYEHSGGELPEREGEG